MITKSESPGSEHLEVVMKMKITFSPAEIKTLVDAEVRRRGFTPLSKAQVLVSTRLEGYYTNEHEVTSFDGVEIDVEDTVDVKRQDAPSASPVYFKQFPDYGDLIPLEKGKLFTGGFDGSGYWATDKGYSPAHGIGLPRPDWATHVMYFSK